jgi:rubredoxin
MEVELLPEPGTRDCVGRGIALRRTVDCPVCGLSTEGQPPSRINHRARTRQSTLPFRRRTADCPVCGFSTAQPPSRINHRARTRQSTLPFRRRTADCPVCELPKLSHFLARIIVDEKCLALIRANALIFLSSSSSSCHSVVKIYSTNPPSGNPLVELKRSNPRTMFFARSTSQTEVRRW